MDPCNYCGEMHEGICPYEEDDYILDIYEDHCDEWENYRDDD